MVCVEIETGNVVQALGRALKGISTSTRLS